MHIRHHAQRKHVIDSLETLLYQLHVLSFFLSPSILALVTRSASQFQLSKPRDVDPKRSLRFWFFLIVLFNFGSIWTHALQGAAEGRAIILDFIGMAYKPSKFHLLYLDFLILALSFLITTIAYETSYTIASPSDILDPLQPTSSSILPSTSTYQPISSPPSSPQPEGLIIDFHISMMLRHIRNPPPPPPEHPAEVVLLPLPNTTSWPLSQSLRMLLRARASARGRAQEAERAPAGSSVESESNAGSASRTVPGGMDPDDGG
ncbi:hypothetical protein EW146_g952 [Bondarzewia mesenterica]|uniref:DUF1746 domain-containing protein n=1 Tax=Bondarzewia mesenterica TaxID=1095465 RepID=A0A4S4M5H2_9AGAM|nr:hypothetical protein EW146_g952 [Bondarzewia mesenterica]